MRLLLGPDALVARPGEELTDKQLIDLYAWGPGPLLRVNFVATIDGAVSGADGRSGSIHTPADTTIFGLLRATCDAVLVGSGTALTEGYHAPHRPKRWAEFVTETAPPDLVIISGRRGLPESLLDAAEPSGGQGRALLATTASNPTLAESLKVLGEDRVIVAGETDLDWAMLKAEVADRCGPRLLLEGGPTAVSAAFAAEVVDDICVTTVPLVTVSDAPRMTHGAGIRSSFAPVTMLEADGTILARWGAVAG